MSYASRTSRLKAEGAYKVLARAQALEASGREIIHLEIGQPDFETFDSIRLAGIRAIAVGLDVGFSNTAADSDDRRASLPHGGLHQQSAAVDG